MRSKNFDFEGLHIRNKPKSGANIVINNDSQNRNGIFFELRCNFLDTYIYKMRFYTRHHLSNTSIVGAQKNRRFEDIFFVFYAERIKFLYRDMKIYQAEIVKNVKSS